MQVRGGCKNLTIDLGVVLEGQHAWEVGVTGSGVVLRRWLGSSGACDWLVTNT